MTLRASVEDELDGLDLSEHGEGGAHDLEEWGMAPGRRAPLGAGVVVHARPAESKRAPDAAPVG